MHRAIVRVSVIIDQFCRSSAVGFLIAMVLLVLFQVVARYLFQSVPVWTAEAARYCMVWGGLLGATAAYRADIDPRLVQPPRTGSRVWVITAFWLRVLGTVIFLGPVLYFSDRFLICTWQRTTEALGIPSFWVTVSVPLAITVIFIHLLARIVSLGKQEKNNNLPVPFLPSYERGKIKNEVGNDS